MISVDPANDLLLDEMPRLQLTAARVDDIALFVHNEADFATPDVTLTLTLTLTLP